jgi:hypothetical protein
MDFEMYDKYMNGAYDPADCDMRKKAKVWKLRQTKRVELAKEFKKAREKHDNKKS